MLKPTKQPQNVKPRQAKEADLNPRKLAKLRGLSERGIRAALADGVLAFEDYRREPAWFIRDEHAGSARRLDGEPWKMGGKAAKALDVSGTSGRKTVGWPVGILRARQKTSIIVCEGGPDMLAAYSVREQLGANFGIVCVFGARLTLSKDSLAYFTRKRVRFLAHADEPGRQFAERNAALLVTAGAEVTIVALDHLRTFGGSLAGDLCNAVTNQGFSRSSDELSAIFDFNEGGSAIHAVRGEKPRILPLPNFVTQEDTRSTQGGHKRTQRKGEENSWGCAERLHDLARELASTARGQSNRHLFDLARACMAHEKNRGCEDSGVRTSVFEAWYSVSQSNLDPVEKRPSYLARFRLMFRKVRIVPGQRDTLKEAEERAGGSTLPEIPEAPDAERGWRVLSGVMRELQRAAGDAPFFISTRAAARIANRKHAMEGVRILEALTEFGVIKCVRRGEKRPGGDASEYRYLLSLNNT